jgi:hypothetical protein
MLSYNPTQQNSVTSQKTWIFSNNAVRNSSTARMQTADRTSSDSECVFLLDKTEMSHHLLFDVGNI